MAAPGVKERLAGAMLRAGWIPALIDVFKVKRWRERTVAAQRSSMPVPGSIASSRNLDRGEGRERDRQAPTGWPVLDV